MTENTMTDAQNHHDLVTLEKHVTVQFEAFEKTLKYQMDAIKATMAATDKAIDVRLDSMNELRDQINQERGKYVSRVEHDQVHAMVASAIRNLELSAATIFGKASVTTVYWTAAVSFTSVLLAAVSLAVAIIQRG